MKEIGKKIFIVPLLVAFVFSTIMPNGFIVNAEETVDNKVVASIYPLPQVEEVLKDEGTQLIGTVNLVVHGEQHDITETAIKKLLDDNNIQYTVSDKLDSSVSNVYLSSDKNLSEININDLGGDITALDESQGYILKTENNNIYIVGSDKDGVYNGIETLNQIFDQKTEDGRITSVVISDYPDIKLRGYVEGFYGYPWTFEQRASMLKEVGKLKMNTYIYAPKDDPYHLANWRVPYPEKESKELEELAKIAHENNIDFVWSVHPGNGYNYNNDNDFNALIAKFESLYALGIRQFGVSYDDLGGYVNANQHAGVLNRIDEEWVKVKGDVKPLITVGTRYANAWGPNNYIGPFLQAFEDTETIVMMTGNSTMSPIKREYFEWPKKQGNTTRDVAAWWNYPVNDYVNGNMMMAPLETVDNDVDNLAGFFLNPMSQAEASKVAIFSGADYSWNVGDFEATSSWKRAIKEIVPDVNEAFERFADNISHLQDGVVFDESRYLIDLISEAKESLETGVNTAETVARVRTVFEELVQDVELLKNMENKEMLKDVGQHLIAYEITVQAGMESVNALEAALNADIKTTLDAIDKSNESLIEADKVMIQSMDGAGHKDNKVNVFEKRVKPFIKDLNNYANTILMDTLFTVANPEVTVENADTLATVTLANGVYTVSNLEPLEAGNNVTIALGVLTHISELEALGSNLDSITVQYSINGHDWNDLNTTNDATSISGSLNETIAYLRFNITEDVTIDSITLSEIKEVTSGKASTNLNTYDGHVIANAFDNNMSTKFYSSSGSKVGSYIQIELDTPTNIYDASIIFATNPKGAAAGIDGFKATKISYSEDGNTWTDLTTKSMSEYEHGYNGTTPISTAVFSIDGVSAKYWRFSATQAYDNWVQVYEVEFNKGIGEHISLVDTTLSTGTPKALYDKDLSTYYEPTVSTGDSIEYILTTITHIDELIIVQDETRISNANFEVQALDGTWKDVGVLDSAVNTLTVRDEILRVRLTFTDVQPRIAEIIETNYSGPTDLTDLELAINDAEGILPNEALYTRSSWELFTKALDTAKAITPENSIGEVAKAKAQLEAAQASLVERASELAVTLLKNTVDRITPTEEKYSEEEFADMKLALEEAQAILDDSTNFTELEVNSAILALTIAEQDLLDLNDEVIALDALKQHIEVANLFLDGDTSNIRPGKLEALTTAVDAAQALVDEFNRDLDAINIAKDAITDAMQELWEIVDKTDLNKVIEIAEALKEELYTPETWTVLNDTLEVARVVAGNDDATVEDVQNAQQAILEAIDGLEVRLVYTSLEKEIATVKAILANGDLYVPSTVTNLTNALSNAEAVLANATTQADIDDATAALIKAKLSARLRADTTKLEDVIAKARSIDTSLYTEVSVQKLNKVLEEATLVLNNLEVSQITVDAMEVKVQEALNNLVDAGNPTDPVKPTPDTDKDKDGVKPTQPSTGISNSLLPFITIAAISVIVLVVLRKKRSN